MEELPNLDYIKELAGDDKDFEQKFITIIKEEFPLERQIYLDHILKDEPRAAAEIVHKIKHKFNILGLEEAYRFAVAFEEELHLGNRKMDEDFKAILKKIETYLKTI
ncbi:MAG: Hpt domain-containing protein [Flavobacteriaceae bacterium]